MSRLCAVLWLVCLWPVRASTYYIDYMGGADANSGQDKTQAWKHQPFMPGFTGKYAHAPGDRFLFKGGVTWPADGCLVWIIKAGGTEGNPDYYGVDQSWYAGAAWSRPVIDGQSAAKYFVLFGDNISYRPTACHVVFDNFELKNLYWSGKQQWGNVCFFSQVDGTTNIVIQNSFIHDWTHGSSPDTHDDLICIVGTSAPPYNAGCVVTHCVIDGGPANAVNGRSSGAAFKQWGGKILHCQIKNCVSAIMQGGGIGLNSEVAFNDVGPVFVSFDPNQHDNGIHTVLGGDHYIHDNFVHDTQSVMFLLGESANERNWCWNNVLWNPAASYAVYFDTTDGGAQNYWWNNTIVSGRQGAFRVIFRGSNGTADTISLINNHVIYGGNLLDLDPRSRVIHVTNQNNVNIPPGRASSEHYHVTNRFRPVAPSGSSVGAGQNLGGVLDGALSKDRLGVARPSGAAWDVGAYHFVPGGIGSNEPPIKK